MSPNSAYIRNENSNESTYLDEDSNASNYLDNDDAGELTTKEEGFDIKKELSKIVGELKELKAQMHGVKKVMKRILQEPKVRTPNSIPETSFQPVMPESPFEKMDDFKAFEATIHGSEKKFHDLTAQMQQQTASNGEKFIKIIWKRIICDKAAQDMCWKGTDKKMSVRALTTTQALRGACSRKFPAMTDAEFEKTHMKFFQYAKTRFLKKELYKQQKSTVEV